MAWGAAEDEGAVRGLRAQGCKILEKGGGKIVYYLIWEGKPLHIMSSSKGIGRTGTGFALAAGRDICIGDISSIGKGFCSFSGIQLSHNDIRKQLDRTC